MNYCQAPECERETGEGKGEGRKYCPGHWKQMQRHGRLAVLKERPLPMDRFWDAVSEWAVRKESDDDAAYNRAEGRVVQLGRQVFGGEPNPETITAAVREARSEATRGGQARARANGVKLGRPARVTTEDAARMVRELGGTRSAAASLGISRNAVRRALRRKAVHATGSNSQTFGPTREGAAP